MGAGKESLPTFRSRVGGREVEGRAGLRPAVNPATGEAFAQASLLEAAQAGEAVAAAQAAFPAWSRTSFRERTRLLDHLRQAIVDEADEIARLIEREQGKPFAEALAAEILPSLDALQHLSARAEDLLRDDVVESHQLLLSHKDARLVYAPIGIVLAIEPWNYPWAQSVPVVASALVGRHNLANILGAAAACLHLGLPCSVVQAGIANLRAVPGRFEKVEAGQPFGVVVDYAHTPDALERVLTFAREYARGRVIVVFGCGGDRDRGKRPRMGEAAARLADAVFATSDNPRSEDPEAILAEIEIGLKKTFANATGHATIPDRREAIGAALASARGGDLVVIAGKGHETYQILRDRTIPFDDRVVAREALTALGYGASGSGPASGGP